MKIFVWTKKSILMYMLLFCSITCLICFNWSKTVSVFENSSKKDLPIYCVDKQEKICSLSFDAAWGNEDTEMLIKELGDYDVKATFFVVGSWVDKFPESVKQLHEAGHEIGNHSDTHPHVNNLSLEKNIEQIQNCSNKIEKITGEKTTLYRGPYGEYNDTVIRAAKSQNHTTIQWNLDTLDYTRIDRKRNVEKIRK